MGRGGVIYGTLTFGQGDRGDLPRLYGVSVECNQEERVTVDGQRHRARTGTSGVSDAESVPSAWHDRERGQRHRESVGLTTFAIDQKHRRLRAALVKHDLRRMLPLAHQYHVTRIVGVVKGAMRLPEIRLLHDQRAENAVGDVRACGTVSVVDRGSIDRLIKKSAIRRVRLVGIII